MFRNIMFKSTSPAEIPSTTNGGEMSQTEHDRQVVRKPGASGVAVPGRRVAVPDRRVAAQDRPVAAPDRRVRRTRKLLHDAFLALVIEKGYEKTTIQDILDRADVGRSTFYVHYRDKEALLTACFDGMREQLEREFADIPAAGPIDVTLPAARLFEHAYRNQQVYRAMCGRQGGALVQRYLRRLIGDLLRKSLRPQFSRAGTEVPADVAAEFYTSGALGLLVWWIDQDFCGDHAWLTAVYQKLAAPDRFAT
jgi:AcrR family transcriptional regulator